MCQIPRGNCLPLPLPASACRFLSCRHPHTPPYSFNRNYFPSPLQAHDASRMWMSVPVPHPAAPHGTCTNLPGSFRCICHGGYTGPFCDQDIDDCAPSKCRELWGRFPREPTRQAIYVPGTVLLCPHSSVTLPTHEGLSSACSTAKSISTGLLR